MATGGREVLAQALGKNIHIPHYCRVKQNSCVRLFCEVKAIIDRAICILEGGNEKYDSLSFWANGGGPCKHNRVELFSSG